MLRHPVGVIVWVGGELLLHPHQANDEEKERKGIMKWTKKTRTTRFTVLNNKLFPIIDTIYVSDCGHVILKDHTSGYWYGNHWFNQLKDAKACVEREG